MHQRNQPCLFEVIFYFLVTYFYVPGCVEGPEIATAASVTHNAQANTNNPKIMFFILNDVNKQTWTLF